MENELFDSLSESDLQRLFQKINKTDDCWLWTGGKAMSFRIKLGVKKARQILFPGPLLDGHVVTNTCDDSTCVRPEHLQQVPRGKHGCVRKPGPRGKVYPLMDDFPEDGHVASDKIIHELTPKQVTNFFKKINKVPDGCWLWTGMKTLTKRAKVKLHGVEHIAARVSFAYHHKIDPGPWSVLHSCDNPRCVNPDHLWLGTHQDNMQDCIDKGRFQHSRGNTKVMDDPQLMKIVLDTSIPVTKVAEILRISRKRVWELRRDFGKGTSHRGRRPGDWAE